MTDSPLEPARLRWSRAAARLLPKGRSVLVRSVARATGCARPFFADVGPNRFLIDLNERVSRTLYLYQVFEPTLAAFLPILLSPGETFIDAGANFGYFTVLAARAVTPAGKVFAFEPDPRNITRLQANIAANDLRNVEHVAQGLFDRVGEVTFNLAGEGEDNLGSSSIVEEKAGRSQMTIQITALDAFAGQRGLDRIGLMKMDIQGAEVEALAGAQRLIQERRLDRVLVEIHNVLLGEARSRAIAGRFKDAGYHAYLVKEDAPQARAPGQFLEPLEASAWLTLHSPHCLFTCEPVAGAA